MASSTLLVFTVFLSLIFAHIGVDADASIPDVYEEVKVPGSDGPDPAILEQFKSKIHSLESNIEEKAHEIKDKDEVIAAKEKIIKEKTDSIVSLESEISSLQKKGKSDAEEQLGKARSRARDLEKEVEKLRKDIDAKIKEKELLEARATEAEKRASELNPKFDSLQKTIDDQKTKIRKFERALQIAEEELMKAKFEATSKIKELMEVHGAWLPPWLALHVNNYRSLLEENWRVHGKPALETLTQKAIEIKAQAEEWAAPHVETVKTKWVPAIQEQWVVITTNIEPHVKTLTTKTVEIYEVSKDALTPHIIKVQELADPYYQELRKLSKPYIDQVATAAKPHVDKLHTTVKPYTMHVVRAYGKFLKSATTYHSQVKPLLFLIPPGPAWLNFLEEFKFYSLLLSAWVKDVVHEKLKSHELTKHLATKELVWFSASSLLALPIIFLLKIFSAIFGKKAKKPIRNGNANHSRRKGKRVHSDK
ncbi:hypothetical protein CASFOL_041907 [Castilleja foliolosa]|uniref:Uncharacterized protein n=1 Tax=Castilleja foliolosa TaxID=1961234 RepID=A0ABD3B9I4_9LAMI